ncbi:MAG: hypothetical protein LBH90_04535 [Tannerella sp.]|jgi:hypothetical protein|nr:hypothetical protein [Tannerella sp.]
MNTKSCQSTKEGTEYAGKGMACYTAVTNGFCRSPMFGFDEINCFDENKLFVLMKSTVLVNLPVFGFDENSTVR